MESEPPPTRGNAEEAVQADRTLSGKYFGDTIQRVGSPKLSRVAVPPFDAKAS
jgi:hypothetical protein